MKRLFLTLTSAGMIMFFAASLSTSALDLSKPIAGDTRCGASVATACKINTDLFAQMKDVFLYAIIIVIFLSVGAVVFVGVKGLTAGDQARVINEEKKQILNSVTSILIAIFLIGGLGLAFFKALTQSEYWTLFSKFLSYVSEPSLFGATHVFAADAPKHLPNALVINSVYDLFVVLYQLAMRWIVIPVLIAAWVYSGFLFVASQGNSDKIKKAKERLWYSFVWTIVLLLVLGLAYSLRDTFNQIFT